MLDGERTLNNKVMLDGQRILENRVMLDRERTLNNKVTLDRPRILDNKVINLTLKRSVQDPGVIPFQSHTHNFSSFLGLVA